MTWEYFRITGPFWKEYAGAFLTGKRSSNNFCDAEIVYASYS